jgi:hypothetical protein
MSSRIYITAIAVISLIGMSEAQAGQPIGTAKARGDFRSFGSPQRSVARSNSGYRYRAPVVRSETVIVQAPTAAPETAVAQAPAPADQRRMSHDPAAQEQAEADAPATSPCPGVTAQSGRRYSYSPEAAAPVVGGQTRRSYATARNGAIGGELWSLPKTDPRKFNSR